MPTTSGRRIQNRNNSAGTTLLNTYKAIAIIFAIIIIIQTAYIFYPSAIIGSTATVTIPDLSTSGFVRVDKIVPTVQDTEGSLSLRSGCYDLTAGVEPFQAISVQNGLDGKVEARPNAHDIAKDVFSALKIDLLMVKVTERRDNSFFAKMVFRQGNTILNFDARPSDAIAIAVRTHADVYINQTLLAQEGKKVC